VLSRPFYFAFYLLGAEVFAVKLGPDEPATAPRAVEGGGLTGSQQIGFTMGPDPIVIARDGS
jgi:hypothetical protein